MIIIAIIFLSIFLILLTIRFIGHVLAYIDTKNYIKIELSRAVSKDERNHYKRELKAIRLSFFTGMRIEKARRIIKRKNHL